MLFSLICLYSFLPDYILVLSTVGGLKVDRALPGPRHVAVRILYEYLSPVSPPLARQISPKVSYSRYRFFGGGA